MKVVLSTKPKVTNSVVKNGNAVDFKLQNKKEVEDMSEMNIFKYAAKRKLRFPYKGNVTVEDLYGLSVEELDKIYKALKREEKAADEDSLLETAKVDKDLEVKIAIIKDIVSEKQVAAEKAKKAAETKAKKQRILEAIAKKDEEAMDTATKEELEAMLEELDAEE